jgi:hypothetical protein
LIGDEVCFAGEVTWDSTLEFSVDLSDELIASTLFGWVEYLKSLFPKRLVVRFGGVGSAISSDFISGKNFLLGDITLFCLLGERGFFLFSMLGLSKKVFLVSDVMVFGDKRFSLKSGEFCLNLVLIRSCRHSKSSSISSSGTAFTCKKLIM